MRYIVLILIMLSCVSFGVNKLRPIENLTAIMTDEKGLPLDDGFYNVTFRVYDSPKEGNLLSEKTEKVESVNGTCKLCHQKLQEMSQKGYKEVWVSLKIENYPESKFRIRVFFDDNK